MLHGIKNIVPSQKDISHGLSVMAFEKDTFYPQSYPMEVLSAKTVAPLIDLPHINNRSNLATTGEQGTANVTMYILRHVCVKLPFYCCVKQAMHLKRCFAPCVSLDRRMTVFPSGVLLFTILILEYVP